MRKRTNESLKKVLGEILEDYKRTLTEGGPPRDGKPGSGNYRRKKGSHRTGTTAAAFARDWEKGAPAAPKPKTQSKPKTAKSVDVKWAKSQLAWFRQCGDEGEAINAVHDMVAELGYSPDDFGPEDTRTWARYIIAGAPEDAFDDILFALGVKVNAKRRVREEYKKGLTEGGPGSGEHHNKPGRGGSKGKIAQKIGSKSSPKEFAKLRNLKKMVAWVQKNSLHDDLPWSDFDEKGGDIAKAMDKAFKKGGLKSVYALMSKTHDDGDDWEESYRRARFATQSRFRSYKRQK